MYLENKIKSNVNIFTCLSRLMLGVYFYFYDKNWYGKGITETLLSIKFQYAHKISTVH